MPTLAEIYRSLQDHETAEKTASVKQAIASPHGGGQPGIAATLEDVLGSNVAETKVRIKKKLEEVAGGQQAVEGLGAHPEEATSQIQAPANGPKLPPGGEKGVQVSTGLSGKVSELLNKGTSKSAEVEKSAEEKIAEEYFAAGQIQAQGFVYELNRITSGEGK